MKFSVCPYSTSPTAATSLTRPAAMQTNSAPAPVAQDVTFNLLVPEVMKLICWSVSDMGRRGGKKKKTKGKETKQKNTHTTEPLLVLERWKLRSAVRCSV